MKFFDRDLSWLSFNYRVLMEASDETVPLFERLRFIAIYSSNLDEFFRVRVANIRNILQIDKKKINKKIEFDAETLLKNIHQEVNNQLNEYGKALDQIIHGLSNHGHIICTHSDQIPDKLKGDTLHFFRTKLSAFLQPIAIDTAATLFLDNQSIYLVVTSKSGPPYLVNIPSEQLGRFVHFNLNEKSYYLFLEDIIRLHLPLLFPQDQQLEALSIKLNKDADLQIDDEYSGNLVRKIEKQIQKRNLGSPSRFLFDAQMDHDLLGLLASKIGLNPEEMIAGGRYHNLNDFLTINNADPQLNYPRLPAIPVAELSNSTSIFRKMEKKDYLFHFPYHSYDYVLQYFNEASIDPEVQEINVTFYRMAKDSIIGEALISAARNGKKVAVFMEVKARFDEKNNLAWARKMQEAGIKIIYSLPGLKVHAKVALVKKKDRYYGFFGTGNLNEKTSSFYCDHGLLTTHSGMTQELSNLFQHLLTKSEPPPFNELIISQFGAQETFMEKIEREIQFAEEGKEARIIVKVNNLQEQSLIGKLEEASNKGVDVKLIVRSICCAIPHDKLPIKRIVDRFLEHARVFYFHNNGQQDLFLGSADWMNRNLHRRIEVCFPIHNDKMKQELLTLLKFQWKDDVKGVWLTANATNERPPTTQNVRAQMATYEYLNTDKEI